MLKLVGLITGIKFVKYFTPGIASKNVPTCHWVVPILTNRCHVWRQKAVIFYTHNHVGNRGINEGLIPASAGTSGRHLFISLLVIHTLCCRSLIRKFSFVMSMISRIKCWSGVNFCVKVLVLSLGHEMEHASTPQFEAMCSILCLQSRPEVSGSRIGHNILPL